MLLPEHQVLGVFETKLSCDSQNFWVSFDLNQNKKKPKQPKQTNNLHSNFLQARNPTF